MCMYYEGADLQLGSLLILLLFLLFFERNNVYQTMEQRIEVQFSLKPILVLCISDMTVFSTKSASQNNCHKAKIQKVTYFQPLFSRQFIINKYKKQKSE